MNKVAEDYYVLEDRVYMENSLGHQPLKKKCVYAPAAI